MSKEHARQLRRSCHCLGLDLFRAAWYKPPQEWTGRAVALIAALNQLVDAHSSWEFWPGCPWLRKQQTHRNREQIDPVDNAVQWQRTRATRQRLPQRARSALSLLKQPNPVGSIDFPRDGLACERRFRTFNVMLECVAAPPKRQ